MPRRSRRYGWAAALLTAAEKFADADWVRPNLRRIGGGVLADGITTALSGAFCVFGVDVSAASMGLSEASGVASRVVAYAISAIFLVMAFIPGLMRFFTLMPTAVIGATFIFTSCAIIKGGIETIASRMLDARRTLVVGLSILTGLAVEAFPGFCRAAPAHFAAQQGVEARRYLPSTRAHHATGSFNEFDLAVEVCYAGDLLKLPEHRPSPDEIAHADDGVQRLSGRLLRQTADRSSAVLRGDGGILQFQFHH